MRKGIFTFFALLAIVSALSISLADADRTERNNFKYGILQDDGTVTVTPEYISNAKVIGFVCGNHDCSEVSGRLWRGSTFTSQGTEITLQYPETLLSHHGYAIFMFKEGYFPYEVRADYSGTDASDPQGPFTNILAKKQNCYANITDLTVRQVDGILSVDFQIANTSFNILSPVDYNVGVVKYNPPQLQDLLTVKVDAKVTLMKDGEKYEERFVRQMNPAEKSSESFEFTVSPGNYTVEVSSLPNDIKCINSQERKASRSLSIVGVDVPNDLPVPTIRILSPENGKVYNTSEILINIETKNATEVWYSINNGANIIYNGPTTVTFQSGEITLRAFAKNNQGVLVYDNVTFRVAPIIPGDTTPPAPVTNLVLENRTASTLTWKWINPAEADFDHILVTINNGTPDVVRGNIYTATGLQANTSYTIKVYTVDTSGNINENAVSRTDTTLARQIVVGDDNDDDDDGEDEDRDDDDRINRLIDDVPLAKKVTPTAVKRNKITLKADTAAKSNKASLPLNTLSIILLIGSFILLVVLLIVALSRLNS